MAVWRVNSSTPTRWLGLCLATALVGMGVLSGCEFRRVVVNTPLQADDTTFIVPGQTTVTEVLTKFGPPDELSGSEDHAVFRYRFLVLKTFRVDFGKLLRYWTPITPDLIIGRGNMGTDVFQVTFDRHWVVLDHAFAKRADRAVFSPWPF
jgi:hypothetical protein